MELSVIRKYFKERYTIGKLMIDGEMFCSTLEDKVRDLKDINHDGDFNDPGEGKIYGETAIPCGRYQVLVTFSPKFQKRLPELFHVPGFTNIRIHAGSDHTHTEGCILVGDNKQKGRLVNGGYYQVKLVELIDKASENGEKTFIKIEQA